MITFLKNWIEQIVIAVIIVSVFELILPNGNLKKYIKVVLGIYIVFCIISPFVNNSILYNFENIDLDKYFENATETSQTEINQESMDRRLEELYLQEIEKDIKKRVEENGYKMIKCNIDANLKTTSQSPGIHKIDLIIDEKNLISDVEKIKINIEKEETNYENSANVFNEENVNNNNEEEKINILKENIANYYEVSKEIITIKLK